VARDIKECFRVIRGNPEALKALQEVLHYYKTTAYNAIANQNELQAMFREQGKLKLITSLEDSLLHDRHRDADQGSFWG
jgi:hypothetical protein